MNKYWLVLIFATLYLSDRIAKLFFKKILLINADGFYGLIPGSNLIFIIVSFMIIPVLATIMLKTKNPMIESGVVLVITGAFANLTDRILFGGALDIEIRIFDLSNALNLADIYIAAGIIILIISTMISHD